MQKISMQTNTNQTIGQAFNNYIKKCSIKNLSQQTIKIYKFHYETFEKSIGGKDTLLCGLDEDNVDNFILYLRENNNCNDITINSYMRSIRVFLYFLMDGRIRSI